MQISWTVITGLLSGFVLAFPAVSAPLPVTPSGQTLSPVQIQQIQSLPIPSPRPTPAFSPLNQSPQQAGLTIEYDTLVSKTCTAAHVVVPEQFSKEFRLVGSGCSPGLTFEILSNLEKRGTAIQCDEVLSSTKKPDGSVLVVRPQDLNIPCQRVEPIIVK